MPKPELSPQERAAQILADRILESRGLPTTKPDASSQDYFSGLNSDIGAGSALTQGRFLLPEQKALLNDFGISEADLSAVRTIAFGLIKQRGFKFKPGQHPSKGNVS
jgi:hypothetical protein